MNETQLNNNWPGVRPMRDGKFSFYLNLGNRTYIEGEYFDAESAARALDEAKFTFVQSGHLRRANFYNFPVEVCKWENGAAPQPTSALLTFMHVNPPRYLPLAQRQEIEQKKKTTKEKRELTKAQHESTVAPPSPSKLFAAHQTVSKLLAATPSRLSVGERDACECTLGILHRLWSR